MPKPRELNNWLHGLANYVEDTESPRNFWTWAGIFSIAASLQRKVWLPYGMSPLYPNLYIMIVAPPGRCRKGAPVGFAKKILEDDGIKIPVFVDSPTKRALTKYLDELGGCSHFNLRDEKGIITPKTQSPLAIVSKELSSFLAVNSKEMIEVLTDLFDNHDIWEYKTSEKGTDKIYGPILNCLFASTPSWIGNNLPEEAIGGGFTSRFLIVSGTEKYKFVAIPPAPNENLYRKLVRDLHQISRLVGEFQWGVGAEDYFKQWYSTIEGKVKSTHDERLHAYLERIHIIVLKTAMALHVSYSSELVLEEKDIDLARRLCEEVLDQAATAFGALGRSTTAIATQEIIKQLRVVRKISWGELFRLNYRNVRKADFDEILEGLKAMGYIEIDYRTDGSGKTEETIRWVVKKGGKYE